MSVWLYPHSAEGLLEHRILKQKFGHSPRASRYLIDFRPDDANLLSTPHELIFLAAGIESRGTPPSQMNYGPDITKSSDIHIVRNYLTKNLWRKILDLLWLIRVRLFDYQVFNCRQTRLIEVTLYGNERLSMPWLRLRNKKRTQQQYGNVRQRTSEIGLCQLFFLWRSTEVARWQKLCFDWLPSGYHSQRTDSRSSCYISAWEDLTWLGTSDQS